MSAARRRSTGHVHRTGLADEKNEEAWGLTGVKPAQKDIRKTEGNSVSNFPGNSAGNSAMNPMEKPAGKTKQKNILRYR